MIIINITIKLLYYIDTLYYVILDITLNTLQTYIHIYISWYIIYIYHYIIIDDNWYLIVNSETNRMDWKWSLLIPIAQRWQ